MTDIYIEAKDNKPIREECANQGRSDDTTAKAAQRQTLTIHEENGKTCSCFRGGRAAMARFRAAGVQALGRASEWESRREDWRECTRGHENESDLARNPNLNICRVPLRRIHGIQCVIQIIRTPLLDRVCSCPLAVKQRR